MGTFIGSERQTQRPRSAVAVALLGALLLASSCSDAPLNNRPEAAGQADAEAQLASPAEVAADAPTARPQLIRRANLRLEVTSAQESRSKIEAIVLQQGGDILGLQESQPTPGSRRSTVLRLRVPQARLDATLDELVEIGTVLFQEVTAEDVTNQLVDFEARLNNLRRAEQTLLEIMERSGTVADVLEVARELATTRQTIEQIDASLTNLKNQVAFSAIEVYLVEAQATAPIVRVRPWDLQLAWQRSTRALRSFSIGLLRLLIWLFVFSPYWLSVSLILFFLYRRHRRAKLPPTTEASPLTAARTANEVDREDT